MDLKWFTVLFFLTLCSVSVSVKDDPMNDDASNSDTEHMINELSRSKIKKELKQWIISKINLLANENADLKNQLSINEIVFNIKEENDILTSALETTEQSLNVLQEKCNSNDKTCTELRETIENLLSEKRLIEEQIKEKEPINVTSLPFKKRKYSEKINEDVTEIIESKKKVKVSPKIANQMLKLFSISSLCALSF